MRDLELKFLVIAFLISLVCITLPGFCKTEINKVKTYVVVRGQYDEKKFDKLLKDNCVDGITYYLGWSRVNPNKNVYQFDDIKKAIVICKLNNKKLNLAILPGRWVPNWLKQTNVKFMNWDHSDNYVEDGKIESSKAPIPWDKTYQIEFFKLLEKLSSLVNANSNTINSIAITGGSNTNGIEANLIASESELKRIRFNNNTYERNWIEIINKFVKIFPKNKLTFSVHNMYGERRSDIICQNIISFINKRYSSRIEIAALAFTEENWFRKGNEYADLVLNQSNNNIVLQAIKIYSKDNNNAGFNNMVSKAQRIQPQWLEIWAEDVLNGFLNCE